MIREFDFEANDAGAVVGIFDCQDLISGSFGIVAGGAWATAVLTVVYDAGGGVWMDYPDVDTLTAAAPNSERLDLSFCARIGLSVGTAEGSSLRMFGTFFGKERLKADLAVQ